jgi:hypothetical protein
MAEVVGRDAAGLHDGFTAVAGDRLAKLRAVEETMNGGDATKRGLHSADCSRGFG